MGPLLVAALLAPAGCGDPTGSSMDPHDDPLADAVHLVEVEANQGVAVALVSEGDPVPIHDRNAPLIEGRPTLVRATWETGAAWTPRTVRADLHLAAPDGTHATFTDIRWIDARPSTLADPDRHLAWEIPEAWAREGATLRIETDAGEEASPTTVATARIPLPDTPATLDPPTLPMGFEPGEMTIRVTLVPVGHDHEGSCADIPSLTPDDVETLGELLHRRSPTQQVQMTLREPFIWTEPLDSYQGLLATLAQLRFDDDAHPSEYYAGLVHHCVRTGGQAITIPDFPTLDNGWTRTVVSAWRGSAPLTSTTFVHEMGHAQGRAHVRCTGSEGAPDPNYPYPAGNIGVWGWSLNLPDARMAWLSGNLYHPVESNDYMGYCTGPQHVSDYGWRQVAPFIREISGWGVGEADVGAAAPSETHLLVGLVNREGEPVWFTVPGRSSSESRTPSAAQEAVYADLWSGPLVVHFDDPHPPIEVEPRVLPSSSGEGRVLEVELPPGRGAPTRVSPLGAGSSAEVRSGPSARPHSAPSPSPLSP